MASNRGGQGQNSRQSSDLGGGHLVNEYLLRGQTKREGEKRAGIALWMLRSRREGLNGFGQRSNEKNGLYGEK